MNQFYETKKMFESAIGLNFPISYESWMTIRDDLKAAALYVNFYSEITLAWNKARSEFTPDEDGISIVMQYLCKNVAIISKDIKKYTKSYIYRVAYNSMGCLRRVKRDKDYFDNTTSNIALREDGEEYDIFTGISSGKSLLDEIIHSKLESEIWCIFDGMDKTDQAVVEYLMGQKKSLGKRSATREHSVVVELQSALAPFREDTYRSCQPVDGFDTLRFGNVFAMDDDVSSAVVEMTDGAEAVYYGETRIAPNGSTKVVFFGATQDYIVPLEIEKDLKVIDVEFRR